MALSKISHLIADSAISRTVKGQDKSSLTLSLSLFKASDLVILTGTEQRKQLRLLLGNGLSCFDVDECLRQTDMCSMNELCKNSIGSYQCSCKNGYSGNGTYCVDIDECSNSITPCSSNAECKNTNGSYTCTCKSGYQGL